MTHAAAGAEHAGRRAAHGLILACFFFSGATGLVYQVVWLRMLALVFGHTVYAVTTVLAAFMAGLALGSFLLSRYTGRIGNPIRAYGWLEIAAGGSCALVPLLVSLVSSLHPGFHRALDLSSASSGAVQFALVCLLLLPPTALMGGTLPVLAQGLAQDAVAPGRTVGVLYAVNTAGAVSGAVTAGYVMLPALGNRLTVAVAVAANLVVGAVAIAVSRRPVGRSAAGAAAAPAAPASASRGGEGGADGPRAVWLAAAVLGVSGAVSMTYEVAWTRALALVIGSSTYAFTSMLVAFLVGVAGGSALYSWLLGARPATLTRLAVIQLGIGAAVTAAVLLYERMPELFLAGFRWSDAPGFTHVVQFAISAASLLPATLLIGASLPCAVAIVSRRASRVGRDVGRLYAVNTLGAIGGTLAAGFALIPALGVQAAIKTGIAVNLVLVALVLFTGRRGRAAWSWIGAGAALAAAIGALAIPPWDQRVMTSGAAVYARSYVREVPPARMPEALRSARLLFYRDGLTATVAVSQEGPHLFLRINGKTDAGTARDMHTQLMSGHLPLLVHPAPKTALVIGLGSGITAGAVARHPVERLVVAEIEPAVVEASGFFAHLHERVLEDPRVETVIADARAVLRTRPERYDVIISEPSNPWIGGMASLFSVEFFELARARLRPGGLMLQWLQGYGLFPADLRMVLNTFRAVFPATSVWQTSSGDFLFLGATSAAPIDLARLRARYDADPRVARDLARIGVEDAAGVLGYAMLAEDDAGRFAAGAGLNTDDRLPLEFSAPRALYLETAPANESAMRAFRRAEFPRLSEESRPELERAETRYWIARAALTRGASADALTQFQRALGADPTHAPARLGVASALLNLGQTAEAFELARQTVAAQPDNADGFFLAGLAAGRLRQREQAIAFLERAVALAPGRPEFRTALDHSRRLAPGR